MTEAAATDHPMSLTMTALRDAIAAGDVSAEAAVSDALARIDRHDGTLNAYSETFAEAALERARAVDRREVTGPLAGVVLSVKDLFCTTQGRTTCSSAMLAGYRSPFTATCVARLEDAGAIVIGKTHMDEFAMGSSCETCASGPVRNPYDTTRVPGGSSGGTAASVAARLCSGGLGTDTGGSIRQPAALTGIVGLKPTYGRVSRWGMVAFASSLDQAGPMTRSVDDAALLLAHMAGHDPRDSTSAAQPADDLDDIATPIDRLRVGIARQYHLDGANDPAQDAALQTAIAGLKAQGAELVDVDLPHTDYGIAAYYIIAPAEASSNLARYDGMHFGHRAESQPSDSLIDVVKRSRSQGFGDEVKRRIMLGTYALSSGYYDAYYNRALSIRRLIKRDFDTAFESCDVVLTPTTTGPAFRLGEKADDPLTMYLNDVYTVGANLAGLPGVSLPAGTADVDGKPLPLGMQLIGPAFAERDLLRAARMLESALPATPAPAGYD
ncbi:MAG: Asp-tRNA(Asn)/Glu-tRNA(Gln) amidotransferase subunit GatA [Planctomycetota bacterium]